VQDVVKKLIGKPDGLYAVDGRCYRVAVLFDECNPRREKIAQNAARLYRSGVYVGNCTIIYEVDKDLCGVVAKMLKEQESYIDSANSK
jgi:hypothetical protein